MTYARPNMLKASSDDISVETSSTIEVNEHTRRSESLKNPDDVIEVTGEKLGSGGFGEVFRGSEVESRMVIAVKKIRLSDVNFMMELRNEIYTLSLLCERTCQFLPKFSGAFYKNETVFLAMELGELGRLGRLKGRLNEQHIALVISDIVAAVRFLHNLDIVHCDINPFNVVLKSSGQAMVVDFGQAHICSTDGPFVLDSFGQRGFLAPENNLSRSSFKGFDRKADVWSIGRTAIYLSLGEKVEYRSNSVVPASYSPTFRSFVELTLVEKPAARPNAFELIDDEFLRSAKEIEEDLRVQIVKIAEEKAKESEEDEVATALADEPQTKSEEDEVATALADEPQTKESNYVFYYHWDLVHASEGKLLLLTTHEDPKQPGMQGVLEMAANEAVSSMTEAKEHLNWVAKDLETLCACLQKDDDIKIVKKVCTAIDTSKVAKEMVEGMIRRKNEFFKSINDALAENVPALAPLPDALLTLKNDFEESKKKAEAAITEAGMEVAFADAAMRSLAPLIPLSPPL